MKLQFPISLRHALSWLVCVFVLLAPALASEDAVPAVSSADDSSIPDAGPIHYTLDEYLTAVMARNPAILSAELDAQSIDYARRAAKASYFPKLDAIGSTGYVQGATVSPFITNGAKNTNKVNDYFDLGGGRLTIPVFTDGTFLGINTPPKVAIVQAQKSQADAKVTLAQNEILYRALVIYLQAIAASKLSAILQPKLGALQSQVKMLQIKERYHMVSNEEINGSVAQLAEVNALSQQSQWLTASALIQVTQLLGVDDPRQVQIEAEYPELCPVADYQTLLTSTLLSHPALTTQQSAVDQAKAQHALDQTAFLPSVTSQNSYEWGSNFDPPGTDRWLAALTVSVPLFDGGENYFKVRSSATKLESEKQQLYQVKLDIESDLQAAYTALEDSNVAYATSLVSLNKENLEHQRNEILYKHGQISMADYLSSQIAYADAAYAAESCHFRLLLAYAGLERVSSGAWLKNIREKLIKGNDLGQSHPGWFKLP